jgi:3-hydroxyisobutyrate dehydrogenase-like beta-hydroxyacid dehydrogenase
LSNNPSKPDLHIGFIGIGNMGSRMAGRILDHGFRLTVFDSRPEATQPLLERGALSAGSPAQLAGQCDIICTCLPGPAEFEACFYDPSGILEGIRSGAIVIDHTTNSPLLVRRAYESLREIGVSILDAPVSGGVSGAGAGTLTIQIGGDPAVLDRVRPLLEAIAKNIVHTGGIGAGCICKIAHNSAVFAANLAMIECMTVAIKAGVDANTIVELFQKSGIGRNHDLQVSLPVTLFRGDFEPDSP